VYLLEKWIHFNFSMIRENFYEFWRWFGDCFVRLSL
jgi:hypothetical protein